jgi:hypothetical protein
VVCDAPPGEFRNEVFFALTVTVKEINEENVSRPGFTWQLKESYSLMYSTNG